MIGGILQMPSAGLDFIWFIRKLISFADFDPSPN